MKDNKQGDNFELCGEIFSSEHFPNLYERFCSDKDYAEEVLLSIAKAWHEGNIVSAAQALESDLTH